MPKKQNGFGNAKSFAFNKTKNVRTGKGVGAPGSYPSDRRYGSSVTRTVIEKYDLDSDWVKWRRGFEYYNKGAWYRLKDYDPVTKEYTDSQINSKLYQGSEYEVDVVFDGYKFATKNADSNNHYVVKRTTVSTPDIGVITQVKNDLYKYPEQKKYREIWCKATAGTEARLVTRMIGERLSDGETEATLSWVLTADEEPALFLGKSWPEDLTEVTAEISEVAFNNWSSQTGLEINALVGKLVYIPAFFQEKPVGSALKFDVTDARDYWGIELLDKSNGEVIILDNDNEDLPPSLYDISQLTPIISDSNGSFTLKGTYIYQKDRYQRFYGNRYLTGELATQNADFYSYSVMPYVILGTERVGGKILLKSFPFVSELRFTQPTGDDGTLIFTDNSFVKMEIDEYDGYYYHQYGHVNDKLWMRLNTDVDPWMDEVFTTGHPLSPATIYTCSCPNYAHAILSAPQETQDADTRRINRQRKYPLPTVQGGSSFDHIGLNQAAGKIESWETRDHKMGFKMCKHTIAAMFINNLKVKEPNAYPSLAARESFEEKLDKDIQEVGDEFVSSYKRGGLTTLEIIFALAQGLNLDEVETAYVVLNSKF
jgi:hypothetical protein